MPEQISKYPDTTMEVLESAGATCGRDAPEQQILTRCPRDKFCSFTGGEVCIYGIQDIPRMTQITTEELAGVVCTGETHDSMSPASMTGGEGALLLGAVFLAGFGAGAVFRWIRHRLPPHGQ